MRKQIWGIIMLVTLSSRRTHRPTQMISSDRL